MQGIKIKIFIISLVVVMMSFISTSTLAFYSAFSKASNVVTSGNIQFIIHEVTDSGNEFPKEGVYIVPGDIVSKKVSIESDCEHPFYLRVKIVNSIDSLELSSEECFKLNIDEQHWVQHDGWYYYTNIVNPGEKTPEVFSHVEIVGSKVDNNYLGKTLTLTVKAQAVQSENNPIIDGNTYTALGWPEG